MPNSCHPDCGPITFREDGQHRHSNDDGDCWHGDDEGFDTDSAKQFETLINYVRDGLDKLDDSETSEREYAMVRDELLDLADFHGGQVAREIREAGLPA
jgi:hypothetical protein